MHRQRIYERDDHTCQFCGNGASSLDHLVPRAHGGQDRWDNLAAACGTCNRLKGEAPVPELAASMATLILAGRTSRRHYPPLYWQVRMLGMPHEPIATNPKRGSWFDRTLVERIFTKPGSDVRAARRRHDKALSALVAAVPELDAAGAREELDRLVAEGRLRATRRFYAPPAPREVMASYR